MEAAPDDRTAVQQVLALHTSLAILSAVTLYRQLPAGMARITVRKIARQPGLCPQYDYWWQAQVTTDGQPWEDTGGHACTTAQAAYQAPVQAIRLAERRPSGHPPAQATPHPGPPSPAPCDRRAKGRRSSLASAEYGT